MPVSIRPEAMHGILTLHGDIVEDSALQFEEALRELLGYYRYDRVVIEINSPGGQASALDYMCGCVDDWRGRGKRFGTRALLRASSAAAMLLSLGDAGHREVQRRTDLLYHATRIIGEKTQLTAGAASNLGALLQGADDLWLSRLVAHQVRGWGGAQALSEEGTARSARLAEAGAAIASSLGLPGERRPPRWARAVAEMHEQCRDKQSSEPYRRLLTKRLAQDSSMDVREAWALCLIDSVHGVTQLRPCIEAVPRPSPVGSADFPRRLAIVT